MTKLELVLIVLCIASAGLLAICCDGSNRSRGGLSSGGDSGTGDSTDDDTSTGEDSGTGDTSAQDDLFDEFDCDTATQSDYCRFTACAGKTAYDQYVNSCDDGTLDETACEKTLNCYKDLITCFNDNCPPGSSDADVDAAAIAKCSQDFVTCSS
ncbi:MAG: hypothetical protein GY854_01770 [Deltaproteobacteria bacterium]|nr:hypothetical protein [Deltaproteobacteria bacterium]